MSEAHANSPLDPRLLSWSASHIATSDQCASEIQRHLSTLDVVQDVDLCGSYALRTSINAAEEVDHSPLVTATPIVYPVDIVITLTAECCSLDDVDAGHYLQIRDAVMAKVVDHLAAANVGDVVSKKHTVARLVASAVTPVRLTPLMSASKHAFVARFEHVEREGLRRIFTDIIVHTRPDKVSAKVSSAKAITKHPFYCNLVLEDHYCLQHVQHAHAAVTANAELARAIVSAKLWARHLGLLSAPAARLQSAQLSSQHHAYLTINASADEGISGFVLTSMLVDIATNTANAAASTVDGLLRQLWVHLSNASGLVHRVEGSHMNLLHVANTVLNDERQLSIKQAALTSLAAPKGLPGVLIVPRPTHVCERFDATLVLHCDDGAFFASHGSVLPNSASLPPFPPGREVAFAATRTLTEALQSRLAHLHVTSSVNGSRLVVLASFKTEADGRARLLRGPPIEDRDAVAAFDALWGPGLTSSRQFADGGVFRCVLWPSLHPPETAAVLANAETSDHRLAGQLLGAMVAHVVGKHHTRGGRVTVNNVAGDIADVLVEPVALGAAWVDATGTAGFAVRSVVEKVTHLVKQSSDSLPCTITQISVVSPAARDTEVFPVLPHVSLLALTPESNRTREVNELLEKSWISIDSSIEPINLVAVIDDKRKIPDTPEAIAVMKGAIVAQLAKTIVNVAKGTLRVLCGKAWIDILTDGYVIRLHIAHFREVSLLRALERGAEADALERRMFHSHLHHVFIRSVTAQFPCAAGAMRLAKRWIGAVLMTDYILPEAVELLVAHLYLTAAPRTAHSGFLRFLRFLSNAARFAAEPVVITGDAKETIKAVPAFVKAKVDNPEQGLFLAAPYMLTESPYTVNTPRTAMVERLSACAMTALVSFSKAADAISAGNSSSSSVQALFGWLDCRSFDAVLPFANRIRGTATAQRRQLHLSSGTSTLSLGGVFQAQPQTTDADLTKALSSMVERDAAATAVRQMRAAGREDALFFYDGFAATAAGVSMLRKRKQPLPAEWLATGPQALATLPPSSTTDGDCAAVPASIFESAGVVRKAAEAAQGAVFAPPFLRPPRHSVDVPGKLHSATRRSEERKAAPKSAETRRQRREEVLEQPKHPQPAPRKK